MKHNPKRNNSNALAAAKATDIKLTQTAIHLEYLFDRGVNFKDRVITLEGDIDEFTFGLVDAAMSEMERGSKAGVTIRIHSPGGSVYEAIAVVGRLRSSKCHITTECFGIAMSAATLILACGDKRKMSEYSQFMHHCSSYALEGRHHEIVGEVEQMEREEKMWSEWMASFTSKDAAFWYDTGQHTNYYLNAQQCVEHGIADELL